MSNTVPLDMLSNRTEEVLCSTSSTLTMKADLSRAFSVFLASKLFADSTDDVKQEYLYMFESVNEIIDQAHLNSLAILAQAEADEN